jgi:uncharacterized membrane protein YjjP (DUF1212 family)
VLKLGRALHTYGYPAHRLEEALSAVSARLGLRTQFFSAPTALFASFGGDEEQRTFQIRVDPGGVNLEKLALLDEVAAQVARGRLAAAEGAARVDEIVAKSSPYGPLLTTLCFGLASGAASRFFGGGAREIAASSLIGLAIGLLALAAERLPAMGRAFEPAAATLAALLATAAAVKAGPVSVYITTVAGLIVLIPGFPLTVAMTELATRNLVSGTARLVGACGTFLAIGFGVALGTTLGERLLGEAPRAQARGLAEWTLWAALLMAPLAFTVLLRAQERDTVWIVASGVLGYFGARLGAGWLGPELGAFVGALVVGVGGNAYARWIGRPAAVTIVPGILLLVPGSIGFRSFASLLERQTVLGVEAAFRMTLVAISLVTGLLFANIVLSPRRAMR